jgi:two-component system chemotaxis response regulator CheB
MAKKDIVVLGGSTGSGAVLRRILRALPADFPASVFITTHMPRTEESLLADMLAAACPLPLTRAVEGQPIERGHVYLAVPDRHLLLGPDVLHLGDGPRENLVRPAIDPMFRSAALAYGSRVIGVVLTGLLNDGAAGLHAIKQRGGMAVVQHPLDAEADEMPRAALEAVEADEVSRADEMAELLTDLVRTDAGESPPESEDLMFEVEVAAGAAGGSQSLRRFASPVAMTCPDCHGVLSEVQGSRPLRYRCQIGHAFTAEILAARNEQVDEALRIAMRVMEERAELVQRMARDARATGRSAVAELYDGRAKEYQEYARTLRDAALLSRRASAVEEDKA